MERISKATRPPTAAAPGHGPPGGSLGGKMFGEMLIKVDVGTDGDVQCAMVAPPLVCAG